MAKEEQALALLSDIDKSVYNEDTYGAIPPTMLQKIFNKIEGNRGNAIKLLIYLIMQRQNDDKFKPAEKTICDACGFGHSSYNTARKWLNDEGYISYLPFKSITINYKKIME